MTRLSFKKPAARFTFVSVLTFLMLGLIAHAQTYTPLYNLGSKTGDPMNPQPIGLFSQGRDGALYSTAPVGGSNKGGAAFKITTSGSLTKLADFNPYSAPTAPLGGLTLGLDGNFYGTTSTGGTHAVGTVFSVTPAGVLSILYNFTAGTDDGAPTSAPVLGLDGNLYGTADVIYAGTYGTGYKMTPKGAFTTIHQFKFTDGSTPYQLILGLDGNFYGVTRGGGSASSMGVVFRMSKAGAVKVLHIFTGYPNDGNLPIGTLAQGNDGTLYGTTYLGGTKNWGTVFKVSPTGTGYKVLHNFDRTLNVNDGINPLTGVVIGNDGNLYGTTGSGGKQNSGSLFKITPAGTYTALYSFCAVAGCKDGFYPQTPMVQHTNGKFYGATESGGTTINGGEFFSLDVGLKPFINIVLLSGKSGSVAQILGQGFNGTTSVKFNGIAATFTIVSDTYLTAKVPPTATTGVVTVTTAGSTLTSFRIFKVIPTITSISPTSGPVNTIVTINGTGFSSDSIIKFAGVKATAFKIVSPTQITAAVPTGGKTGKITVTTAGGVATSGATFTVTP
jgi:uncharacterized repeat protein (TIGR03803 family)